MKARRELKEIVRVLLCSAQPWKDSLLSPKAPRELHLSLKDCAWLQPRQIPPGREGGVTKVTPRVLCHGRGAQPWPWHSKVIVVCCELLLQPWEGRHGPSHGTDSPWGEKQSHVLSGAEQNRGVTQAFRRDESSGVLYRARLASSTKIHNLTRGEEKITDFGKQKHTFITEIQ